MKKGKTRALRIAAELAAGKFVADAKFDLVLPLAPRGFSTVQWTPIAVVRRAVDFLRECAGTHFASDFRVLDIGSGCGKFCHVGALLSPARFHGVEQRGELVEAARSVAELLGVEARATFERADATTVDWGSADALYFFNPFYENVIPAIQMGPGVEYSEARLGTLLTRVETRLSEMPSGKYVLTYNGFGGEYPPGFTSLRSEWMGEAYLELFVRD